MDRGPENKANLPLCDQHEKSFQTFLILVTILPKLTLNQRQSMFFFVILGQNSTYSKMDII